MRRILTLALALGTGCSSVGLGSTAPVRAQFDPRLDFPVTRMTAAETPTPATDEARTIDRVSPPLFWTGIALGLAGGAMAIAFAADGGLTEKKIEDGYADGFSRERRDDLQARGDRANALASAGGGLSVAGFSLALIMAGIDYSRCGPLSAKRRKCRAGTSGSGDGAVE